MKFTAIIENRALEIEINKLGGNVFEAEVQDRKYSLNGHPVEPGVYWFNWNNKSIEIAIVPKNEGYIVSVDGRSVPVEIVDSRTALRKAAQHGHTGAFELRAPMPGKIVKVLAVEGAQVQPNQGILVIEAMKMQNEIKSPKNGTVKRIAVKAGAAVNAGDVLAVVE